MMPELILFYVAGEIFKAESLCDQVFKLGHQPDDVAIASLISFYARHQQLQQAQALFAALDDSHAIRSPVYRSMIDAYAKCGKLDQANHLYNEMVDQGNGLDAVAISIIVNAFSNYGMPNNN